MPEVYSAQYHRTDTEKKRKFCRSGFWVRSGDILTGRSAPVNNKEEVRERGNNDGPLKVAYESPFTANFACAYCAEDLPCGIFSCCVVMILGFLAIGLSVYYYVLAQSEIGAARTSAYYAISPFIGVYINVKDIQEVL